MTHVIKTNSDSPTAKRSVTDVNEMVLKKDTLCQKRCDMPQNPQC